MLNKRQQRGFTLVELMVTIVVIAILATIAVPNLRSMLASIRIRGLAESITSGLQYARGEAVKQNQAITFQVGTDASWTVKNTSTGVTIQTKPASEGGDSAISLAVTGTNSVAFTPLGTTTAVGGQLSQIDLSATATSAKYRILVGSGGVVKMCNPNVSLVSDPRYCKI